MNWDTHLSLDGIVLALAILVAMRWLEWRIDRRTAGFQNKAKRFAPESRAEKGDVKLAVYSDLWEYIRRVESKVDDANQRLARLEGMITVRESSADSTVEANPTA